VVRRKDKTLPRKAKGSTDPLLTSPENGLGSHASGEQQKKITLTFWRLKK
jgi:hypothetical protein